MTREIPAWADINTVTLRGRLGRDPELRSTQSGQQIGNFSVATSEKWIDKRSGERKELTEWHRIVIFNDVLNNTAAGLRKGDRVLLTGQIKTRKWTDQSGAEKFSTEIVLGRFGAALELVLDDREPAPATTTRRAPAAQPPRQPGGGSFMDDLDDEIPFAPCWQ